MSNSYTSKQTVITFPQSNIEDVTRGIASGSLQVEEILCESNPVFGKAWSNRFEAQVFGIGDVVGKKIYVYQIDEYQNEYPIFTGWIDSSKLDELGYYRDIIAYDAIYYYGNLNVADWWNTFWENKETTTLRELRLSLCDHVGIASSTRALVNDNFVITKNITMTSISFVDMLYYICELSGVIPNINRLGVMEYIQLNSNSAIDISGMYQSTQAQFEEYVTDTIDQLQFVDVNDEVYYTVGTGDSAYKLGKNFLLFDQTTEQLQLLGEALLNVISHVSYKPMRLDLFLTSLDLKLGQCIETDKGFSYILSNYLSGPTLVDQTVSAAGEQSIAEVTDSFDPFYAYNNAKFASIEKSIEGINTKFGEYTTTEDMTEVIQSEVQQQTQGISATVTAEVMQSIGEKGAVKSVSIQYYLSDSQTERIGGSWSNTAPTWVQGKYMWQRTKIVDINDKTTYSPSSAGVCIAGAKGDKGDDGDDGTNGSDGVGIKSVTPLYYCKSSATKPPDPVLPVTETRDLTGVWSLVPATWTSTDMYYFICSQIEYDTDPVTYAFTEIVSDAALTKSAAQININRGNIELKVNQSDYNGEEIASLINQTAENIKIIAKHINLNGVVTANETFKIDTDGSMEATGGKIGGFFISQFGFSCGGLDENTSIDIDNSDGIKHIGYLDDMASGYTTLREYQEDYTDGGFNLKSSVIDFRKLMLSNRQTVSTLKLDGKTGNVDSTGTITGSTVKTTAGADLDSVKNKVDGNVRGRTEVSARGTSSAFPVANIASIPDGSDIRIEVGVPLDNASTPTVAWFSLKTKKPSGTSDYLFNAGGYYYSNNYYGSVFIRVSASRVTIDGSWSRAYYNGTTLNFKSSSSQIYVYTEHL